MPTISYALTSGPTAPEYTSFEPVDTSDMVNLVTGDLVYNIPLLEVPGPAGGYPLSLSYHAGIQTNQDASWAGLGWSINAGAINRTVNGYADDAFDARRSVVDNWEGGETWSVGVGYGYAGTYAKLTYAEDTYKGSGLGFSVGQSYKIGPIGAQVAYSQGPYGGSSASLSTGVGIKSSGGATGVAISLGANLDLESGKVRSSASIGLSSSNGQSLVGASIGSNQKGSISVGSFSSSQVNRDAGNITTNSVGFGGVVPTPYGDLHLDAQYTRYYSHEESYVKTYGTLYPPTSFDTENSSFDSYPVFDANHSLNKNIETHSVGGFPAYDNFTVLGQGVGGQIQPYLLEFGSLYRQNDNNVSFEKLNKSFTKKVNFRFKNDFSGYFIQQPPSLDIQGQGESFEFNGFNNDESFDYPEDGINSEKNHLAGSNHIEWFTNLEINKGEAFQEGLLSYDNSSVRSITFLYNGKTYDINQQIGGYKITNPSGVTYHYTLPVYAYDEYTRSEVIDESGGEIYRETTNFQPYAYTWLLTAVTGPDYVDRNQNNVPDKEDWGYWTRFHYGKWTSNYQWRNPAVGSHIDLDQAIRHWSWGKKELYYLDAIETASHTALFVKKVRNDGKGVTTPQGGSEPDLSISKFPTSVLGLDEIWLFNNRDLEAFTIKELVSSGETLNFGSSVDHLGDNVLDITDLPAFPDLKSQALRVVTLKTDYSLCPSTINSLDNDKLYQQDPLISYEGKYTLNALSIKGKGGTSLTPPTIFNYGFNPEYGKDDYDIWGFYKDVPEEIKDENFDRLTTEDSQDYVDAWSLSKITTPLGAEIVIEYESDTYTTPDYYKGNIFQIDNIHVEDKDQELISVQFDPKYYKHLRNILNSSDKEKFIKFTTLIAQPYDHLKLKAELEGFPVPLPVCNVITTLESDYVAFRTPHAMKVKEIRDNELLIQSDTLVKLLTTRKESQCVLGTDGFYDCSGEGNCYQYDPLFIGGILSLNVDYNIPGGGIRVKQISVSDNLSSIKKSTMYEYHNMDSPDITSGVTSYEPFGIGYYQFEKPKTPRVPTRTDRGYIDHYDEFQEGLKIFRDALIDERKLLQQSRVIPSPGVFYKNVTVKDKIYHEDTQNTFAFPQYSVYGFNVFEVDKTVKVIQAANAAYKPTYFRQPYEILSLGDQPLFQTGVGVFDYSSKIGQPTSLKTYSTSNTDEPIEEITYSYAEDYPAEDLINQNIGKQGQVNQVFYEFKTVKEGYYVDQFSLDEARLIQLSSIIEYPSVFIGTTIKNYKTGIVTSEENIDFDPFSGAPTKKLTKDSYGNFYLSETVPAYQTTAYSAMGLAINGGKNMISQNAAQYTFKVNGRSEKKEGLVSASIQTWSDNIPVLKEGAQPGIYRKHASFTWNGQDVLNDDGTYPIEDYEQGIFNFEDLSDNSNWEKNSEVMLVDVNSHLLEAKDINGNFAASHMDPGQQYIIASGANASYYELAYSGAEFISGNNGEEGGVSRGEGSVSTARSHTGDFSLQVPFNSKGFNYTLSHQKANLNKKYKASVWVYLPGESETADQIQGVQLYYRVNGQEYDVYPELQKNKSKSWYLLELTIDPKGSDEVYIGCRNLTSRNIYFDDFRVFPLEGVMNSYVYDQSSGELIYILDQNNFYTKYDYDDMGRLIRTSRELLNFDYGDGQESFRADKILGETIYNYGRNNNQN